MKRIEICGGIGAGKTTLATILEQEGFLGIYERFQDNPFLNDFYTKENADNNLENEITFLLLHYNLIKICNANINYACDYSLLQDYCYAVSNLKHDEKDAFMNLFRYVEEQIAPPDLIIYLKCDAECLLDRIKQRGRVMEQGISREYLQSITSEIEKVIVNRHNVLIIESDKYNFIESDRQYVVDLIRNHI